MAALILRRVYVERATTVVVLPEYPAQPWWRRAVSQSLASVVQPAAALQSPRGCYARPFQGSVLANGRVFLPARGNTLHGRRWRFLAADSLVASFIITMTGARTTARLLAGALAASTADRYCRRWDACISFCRANAWAPLPAPAAAVACYFGVLCARRVATFSLQGCLSPINCRHFDAGLPKPARGPFTSRLRAVVATWMTVWRPIFKKTTFFP